MAELEYLHANSWRFLDQPGPYVEASGGHKPLNPASTARQFATAQTILERLNGSYGIRPSKGVLLADDVGLGKTTVATLVAWVVAGRGLSVRVLAPNAVMRRRWQEELLAHVPMLQRCAPGLNVERSQVKGEDALRLRAGAIQVATHNYARQASTLACDLLIVDEAHRAKGKSSSFAQALSAQSRQARRVLILTATPMSIRPDELQRMLALVGATDTKRPLRSYANALDNFYQQRPGSSAEQAATRLAERARAAVETLLPWVIRHGVSDLPAERKSFGEVAPWNLPIREANATEIELMLRMDRALRCVRHERSEASKRTNDPRYHVGWEQLRADAQELRGWLDAKDSVAATLCGQQLRAIAKVEEKLDTHPKMQAVADAVREKVQEGEKVLLFCSHHATAQELTQVLRAQVAPCDDAGKTTPRAWSEAWRRVLAQSRTVDDAPSDYLVLRETFIKWLCSPGIRRQVASWLKVRDRSLEASALAAELGEARARGRGQTTIAASADELFRHLLASPSTLGVLRAAGRSSPELIPGGDGVPVLAVCELPEEDDEAELSGFNRSRQPDTAIAVFNSPFGPEVLVTTDRLSEGIDLHRYCRYLIHYELSPSPVRTIQRNGRLRRVNSWAAATCQPLQIAYPWFGGTRDQRLVAIMKRRIDAFSMLLGGVPDFDHETNEADEQWRSDVVRLMKAKLARLNGQLAVRY